jgi:hypothetical protein
MSKFEESYAMGRRVAQRKESFEINYKRARQAATIRKQLKGMNASRKIPRSDPGKRFAFLVILSALTFFLSSCRPL